MRCSHVGYSELQQLSFPLLIKPFLGYGKGVVRHKARPEMENGMWHWERRFLVGGLSIIVMTLCKLFVKSLWDKGAPFGFWRVLLQSLEAPSIVSSEWRRFCCPIPVLWNQCWLRRTSYTASYCQHWRIDCESSTALSDVSTQQTEQCFLDLADLYEPDHWSS
jgi:hypothetical protein